MSQPMTIGTSWAVRWVAHSQSLSEPVKSDGGPTLR